MRKQLVLSLVISILLINLVSAVGIGTGTTFNTTNSNTSITFTTIGGNATTITVNDNNISITGFSCAGDYEYAGGDEPLTVTWTQVNRNIDSSSFCIEYTGILDPDNPFATAFNFLAGVGFMLAIIMVLAIIVLYIKGHIDMKTAISYLVTVIVSIMILQVLWWALA